MGVNTALAKDDVRSRLVVNIIKCTKQRPALCYYYCSCLTTIVYIVFRSEVLGKLWCVHLLHLITFATSQLLLLTSSTSGRCFKLKKTLEGTHGGIHSETKLSHPRHDSVWKNVKHLPLKIHCNPKMR